MSDRTARRVSRVVVIGGGVAGLSAALTALEAGTDVTVLESADHLGGKIDTLSMDGFIIDSGPDTLVTGKPDVRRLVTRLDLGPRLTAPRPTAHGSVVNGGRLVPLPDGLAVIVPQRLRPILLSDLLSVTGRARAALEVVVPRRRASSDETVESFVTRRLGRQTYDRLAEPLIGGIHAGDVATLGIRETFPHLQQDEMRYGSLARAVLHRRWQAWRARRSRADASAPPSPRPVPAAPTAASLPPLAAPRAGMGELINRLEDALRAGGADLQLKVDALEVLAARPDDLASAYRVVTSAGVYNADAVIFAVPAAQAARLCHPLEPDVAQALSKFPTASVTSVSLGYRACDPVGGLDPTSVAVPATEGATMRSCTVVSRRYAGRAPEGDTLLRVLLRGDHAEDDAVRIAEAELANLLGIRSAPVMTYVRRWRDTMPRYTVGHRERVAALRVALQRHAGLALAGASYDGAGVPDCVASGQAAARAVLTVTRVSVAG